MTPTPTHPLTHPTEKVKYQHLYGINLTLFNININIKKKKNNNNNNNNNKKNNNNHNNHNNDNNNPTLFNSTQLN